MARTMLNGWRRRETRGRSRMKRKSYIVYAGLLAIWLGVVFWQVAEHRRVSSSMRTGLENRARDMSSSLAVVMRSQRRFGGFIPQSRLESALEELVRSEELNAIGLFNESQEVVARAGAGADWSEGSLLSEPVRWQPGRMTLINIIDLGAASTNAARGGGPAIVVQSPEEGAERDDEGRRRIERFRRRRAQEDTNRVERAENRLPAEPDGSLEEEDSSEHGASPERTGEARGRRGEGRRLGRPPFPMGRPPWMNEEEYESLVRKRGVHGFVVEMSTAGMEEAIAQDAWLRGVVGLFGLLAVLAGAFAWRSLTKSTDFELRLLRAREQNTHLREMNLAAAGLAHETRNPLNVIRGIAQMISRQDDAPDNLRGRCREIADEVDRVTGQLNGFINYSRPREVRRTPVHLDPIVGDVLRTLQPEMEDLGVKVKWERQKLTIDADEKLLRQILFNLLLNATQVLEKGGEIEVAAGRNTERGAWIEIRDNGPGVPPESREKMFQPYFTTRADGTGLGLAIVKQIVLAHGWEIGYRPNLPRGAAFRIGKIELANAS